MKTPNVNNFLFELTIITFLFNLVLIVTQNVNKCFFLNYPLLRFFKL